MATRCDKNRKRMGMMSAWTIRMIEGDKVYREISRQLREMQRDFPGQKWARVRKSLARQLAERIHMWEVMPR